MSPKKVIVTFDLPVPPVNFLDNFKVLKNYDLEPILYNWFLDIDDFGDFDWAYFTKFYEIVDWNFQVVRPTILFIFFLKILIMIIQIRFGMKI